MLRDTAASASIALLICMRRNDDGEEGCHTGAALAGSTSLAIAYRATPGVCSEIVSPGSTKPSVSDKDGLDPMHETEVKIKSKDPTELASEPVTASHVALFTMTTLWRWIRQRHGER
ncbi:hypothetical protein PsYK624_058580 [Phanerochaete sordida]|uniref:Uncharacterized protein n=1 Tax=Phanerochaete sordida TaxID=48140 RepID=A0A9P3G5S6_9APHY|nr:hypothetical protein PsYK624_058580 [Phanerochaete sordida]